MWVVQEGHQKLLRNWLFQIKWINFSILYLSNGISYENGNCLNEIHFPTSKIYSLVVVDFRSFHFISFIFHIIKLINWYNIYRKKPWRKPEKAKVLVRKQATFTKVCNEHNKKGHLETQFATPPTTRHFLKHTLYW